MEKTLAYAKYVLALAEGAVTAENREALAAVLDQEDRETLTALLLVTEAKRVAAGEADVESAQAEVRTEYEELGLTPVLGSFEDWSGFLSAALAEAAGEHDGMERVKALITAAESGTADARAGAARAALSYLVAAGQMLTDKEFSRKVTGQVEALEGETAGAAALRALSETVISL